MLVVLTLLANGAHADLQDDINRIRTQGCEDHSGARQALIKSKELDHVAREWSKGGRLRDAIERTNYRASNSASMHVSGNAARAAVLGVLRDNYCEIIIDPEFTHIGSHSADDETWVVVATPFTIEEPDAADVSERALELVNAARAKGRRCGKTPFAAAPALRPSTHLQRAALAHAQDMAKHSRFEHIGSDASRPADRVTRVGYAWRSVGENIAAGFADVEAIVEGWLNSPGHCANIMNPQFTQMGIAFAVDPNSKAGIYWAQVFARPR